MVNVLSPKEDILRELAANNIPIEKPAFYDHPNFTKIEKINPDYLRIYARFVQTRDYDADYLKRAEEEIIFIASILHQELVRGGRLGACIDINMVLSRVLELEGYWNYMVKGGLTIKYPSSARLKPGYYWSVDYGSREAGHVWLSAPPYSVVDISLKQQPYSRGQEKYLPEKIFEKSVSNCVVDAIDVCNPKIMADIRRRKGLSESQVLSQFITESSNFFQAFRTTLLTYKNTSLKYVPCGIGAPETTLENIKSLKLNGMYGIDIYQKIIKPALEKQRAR